MSYLEHRRLRAWDTASEPPKAPWRILVRYGIVRLTRTWWLASLLLLAAVYVVVFLGVTTYAFAAGEGVRYTGTAAAAGALMLPSLGLLVLVGAPLFAEDLRVNAPVFYFSRPLPRSEYLRGKLALLAGLLTATTLLPLAILSVLLLVMGVPLAEFDPGYRYQESSADFARAQRQWEATSIDTLPDALYSIATILPAAALVLAFLGSATALASSYTRRAWHAGVAVLAVLGAWSMLGAMAEVFTRTSLRLVFGPMGWIELVLGTSQDLYYLLPARRAGLVEPYWVYDMQRYDHAAVSVMLAYVLLAGFSALFTYLTVRRVRQQEVSL